MSTADRPAVTHREDSATAWPLLPDERDWRTRQLFVVLLVAASATWCYVIGEYVGFYLPLVPGAFAMTAGAMIGMLLVTLAVVPSSSRYGIDSIQAAVPQFGRNGWVVTVALQYLSIIGWNSLLLIFFGKSLAEFLNAIGIGGASLSSWIVPIGTLVACAIVFLVLIRGATGLERVSMVLFFFIVGVGAFLIVMLLVKQGTALADAQPAYASGKRLDYMYGVEIGLVSLLSWWPYIGSMTRQAPNPRVAVMPSMLGMGLPVPVLSIVGLASILALQTSDPAQWLTKVGGDLLGAVALLFVIAANFGTAVAGIYASTVGLKAVPGLRRMSWNAALALSLIPVMVVCVLVPNWFFDHFGTFLAYIGVFFAPMVGIQIIDYFVLRRQQISLRAIYDRSPDAPYSYWAGINPAAVLAMVAGVATYLYLLNPQSYAIREPFSFIGASLPAAVAAAFVHGLVTVLLVRRTGRGGYPAKRGSLPSVPTPAQVQRQS